MQREQGADEAAAVTWYKLQEEDEDLKTQSEQVSCRMSWSVPKLIVLVAVN